MIPLTIKPLQKMFAKNLVENEERAYKRQMRLDDEIIAKKRKMEEEELEAKAKTSNGNAEVDRRKDSLASS